jgi:hypothetical protein
MSPNAPNRDRPIVEDAKTVVSVVVLTPVYLFFIFLGLIFFFGGIGLILETWWSILIAAVVGLYYWAKWYTKRGNLKLLAKAEYLLKVYNDEVRADNAFMRAQAARGELSNMDLKVLGDEERHGRDHDGIAELELIAERDRLWHLVH